MKNHNKFISALLAAVLMFGLVACGSSGNGKGEENNGIQNTENSETIKGRFVESQLNLPEGVSEILAVAKLDDGTLELAGSIGKTGTDCILTSTDEGETWQVKELEDLDYSYISNVAIRNDGTVAYMGYFNENQEKDSSDLPDSVGMKLVSKEGEVKKINFTLPKAQETDTEGSITFQKIDQEETIEGDVSFNEDETDITNNEESDETQMTSTADDNMVLQAAFDEAGSLIIQDLFSTFYKLNIETGELSELYSGEEYIPYFGIAGNKIYAAAESGMKIFSSEDGSMSAADSVLDEVAKKNSESSSLQGDFPVVMTKGMEDNSLVYANHQGVFYHLENGSVSEQLINGELCSLSDTTLGLSGIVMVNEKSYLISARDSMGNIKLLKYVYDENASSVPEKQLKVYALEDSNLLRQVVANFQSAHSDTFVKVEIGISQENSITAEDALRTLNTDILAGKGPDVLILDGMPVDSYIEKGILADIKGLLDEIEASDGLFTNIKNAYESKGSIYCMPCRFKIPVIAGDKEAVETGSAEGLLDYGKTIKQEGKRVFSFSGTTDLLEELFQVESADWLTGEGSLDQSKLETYLQTAKEIYDLDYDSNSEDNNGKDSGTYTHNILSGYNLGTVSSLERLMKECEISFGTLASFYELKDILSIEKQLGGTYGIFSKQETKSFVPYLMVGIVSGKEEDQDVQEFVKTMFGKESGMQSESGFSVNKAAYEELCRQEIQKKQSNEELSVVFSTTEGTTGGYSILPLTQKEVDTLTENIESMTSPVITDRIIQDLIITEGSKYLEGNQTLEETSAAIMQKVNLYLSE